MHIKGLIRLLFPGVLVIWAAFVSQAQITAPGASFTGESSYPVFEGQDPLFVYCTGEGEKAALLRATHDSTGPKTWEWQKYNPQSGSYEFFLSENNSNGFSQIGPLEDGGYRVNITAGETTVTWRAWVFNNHNQAVAGITESNCLFFTLEATPGATTLVYYDPQSNEPLQWNKNLEIEWRLGEEVLSRQAVRQVYDPPTRDTEYTLVVRDRFGCESIAKVTYQSIVTKAVFTADPMNGEAPLTVNFSNASENGTPGAYEWFFFRDLDDIKRESEKTTLPVDSIDFTAFDDNPVYTYEWSGTYMVKLVSKNNFCTDTAWLEDFIMVDTSFVAVPNVFTPNGDGTNDNFVVKYWSMEKVKISVLNRWGRTVHVWESNNVRGFEDTWIESVWDGRIGGRLASPGVYFYVIEGTGRDGKKRWKHGDVYLIRGRE